MPTTSAALILRSIAKRCVSKDGRMAGGCFVLRDAALRAAPQDEGGVMLKQSCQGDEHEA